METKFRIVGAMAAASAGLGAAIVVIATQIGGGNPANHLADQLGLGSGVVLGAIVGGLLGLWLSLGGLARAARFAGWCAAIGLGVLLWALGRPVVWIFEVLMKALFGPSAAGLGPFVAIGILVAVVRGAIGTLSSRMEELFVSRSSARLSTE